VEVSASLLREQEYAKGERETPLKRMDMYGDPRKDRRTTSL